MESSEAISLINELLQECEVLASDRNKSIGWKTKGQAIISRVFGKDSDQAKSLTRISLRSWEWGATDDFRPQTGVAPENIENAKSLLESFIWEIEKFGVPDIKPDNPYERAFKAIELICNRFPAVVRQLRSRHSDRPTLDIEDEYDVQDLLHALLKLYFDDIRPEEWTPCYAAKSSRMDFLLKKEKVVIEVKKTRRGLDAKQLGEELIIDIARYRNHSDCEKLICFVYDPELRIANPAGIESDLKRDEDELTVRVIITPKH